MKDMGFDHTKQLHVLLEHQTDQLPFIDGAVKQELASFLFASRSDTSFLYQCSEAVNTGQQRWSFQDLAWEKHDDSYGIQLNRQHFQLEKPQLKQIIQTAADLLEDILPLGSVVELKKEYLGKLADTSSIEHARFVITHRFIYYPGIPVYFPYAGLVYPLGTLGRRTAMHFTPPLIEKVVHRGFSDEQEEAFVLMMKRELLADSAMHSFAFSTASEREAYQNRIREEAAAGGR